MASPTMEDWFHEEVSVDLTGALELIHRHPDALTQEQAIDLFTILREHIPDVGEEYGANFDLKAEVAQQIRSVRAMRNQVMDSAGRVNEGMQPRDVKELVTASTTLLKMLVNVHEQVINFDRMKAVEDATVEAIKTLPQEAQNAFFEELDRRLEEID